MSAELALETRGLTKSYGAIRALRGVDLEVKRGEIFGFLGPNGAGKTTTIRCLLDLIRPDGGSSRVLGLDPQADPVAVRARTGYLPGEMSLEANLRVRGVLRYCGDLRGNTLDWNYVQELAERLQLDLTMPVKNLSKGNKQKVGVVQALMSRPELLLMDEPTSGLDPLMQQEVYQILQEAQADGATVFFSSHIISEVEAIAERVAIIRLGVITQELAPSELASIRMRRVLVAFERPVDPGSLGELDGVSILSRGDENITLRVDGSMDRLIKALAAFPVRDLKTERPSLEEVFLAYYENDEEGE
jgi:ABC-2 type transport system ATP-binding protein